jgi:ketosteroid isomerase-like protein
VFVLPRLFGILFSCIVAAGWLAPWSAAADPASEIRARLATWTEDFNAGRWNNLCDLFAKDLIANYPGTAQRSYDSQCNDLLKLANSDKTYHYDLEIQEVIVSGNLAVVRLNWYLTVTQQGTSLEIKATDIGMDIFHREPDGAWRITRYIAFEVS